MKTNNYLLTESMVGSLAIYMILKKLMTGFEEWDAYKLGIIDKDGNKLKHPVSSKEREAWDILTRFTWNIKKISMKFIGKSKFSQYFTAAYLLKDSINTLYVTKNQERLNESLLDDMTFNKQLIIYNILKELPQEKCNEDNIEVMMFKHLQIVEKTLLKYKEIYTMFEADAPASPSDGSGATGGGPTGFTTTSQSSGVTKTAPGQYLGVQKRNGKKPKTKFFKKDLSKIIKSKRKTK